MTQVRPKHAERDQQSLVWAYPLRTDAAMPAVKLQKGRINITQAESDGFWAWAVIETLRHTGIRIEELLELTQLSAPLHG
jgi:hypothetical protein